MHKFILLLIASMLLALSACSETSRPLTPPVTLEGDIFGTFYQVTIADSLTKGQARTLKEGLEKELDYVDMAMSIYRSDSELIKFNNTPVGEWFQLSEDLMHVLNVSQMVSAHSNGAFDVTIGGLVNLWSFGSENRPREAPERDIIEQRLSEVGYRHIELDITNGHARRLQDVFVDLGGVAKGFGTDQVAAYLDEEGINNYLVNLGGDLTVKGYRDKNEQLPWRIGIEAPLDDRRQAQHIIPLLNTSVATSGDYRNYFEEDGVRYSHTIDPRSGKPIQHSLASVTVAHPENTVADAWATAMMVLGEKDGMELALSQNLAVLMLVREDTGWSSYASPAFEEIVGENIIAELEIPIFQ
ncbi:FAD:protein FMN transferase [Halomonas sp. M1]|uniref:FAD:protein FMN transferase n=1 Tax=Halomonas sp. M1 TaxID=3035470 RepID=UPI002484FF6E|nr:FAD:protein FMN transferase [Halomonas sp. M1]WFE71848.1 FAD:protein FMN transferase [Halomonas sp. M1]